MKIFAKALFIVALTMISILPVAAGAESESAEVPLVKYSNQTLGYSISYPQTWMKDSSFANGLKFTGGDNAMTVEIVSAAAGKDLLALAKADAGLMSYYPGAQTLGIAISKEVKGAVVRGFSAKGKSVVTGQAFRYQGRPLLSGIGRG